jgi:hypothetical protein
MKDMPFGSLPVSHYFWRRGSSTRWFKIGDRLVEALDRVNDFWDAVPQEEVILSDAIHCASCWSDTIETEICPVCGHRDPQRASREVALAVVAAWVGRGPVWY